MDEGDVDVAMSGVPMDAPAGCDSGVVMYAPGK